MATPNCSNKFPIVGLRLRRDAVGFGVGAALEQIEPNAQILRVVASVAIGKPHGRSVAPDFEALHTPAAMMRGFALGERRFRKYVEQRTPA